MISVFCRAQLAQIPVRFNMRHVVFKTHLYQRVAAHDMNQEVRNGNSAIVVSNFFHVRRRTEDE
jgi:uncharacterized membrane protein YjfL (UPF0719 family)